MLKKPKILVVDDVPDNLFLLEAIFRGEDAYQLSCADSGKGAIQAVEKSPPDLILLDLMMPDLTGYEVARHIRQNQNLPYISILFVTACDPPSPERCSEMGANGVISKPFDIQQVLDSVQTTLKATCNCGCGCSHQHRSPGSASRWASS